MQFISSKTDVIIFKWAVFSASSSLSLFKVFKKKITLVCLKTFFFIAYVLELVIKGKKGSLKIITYFIIIDSLHR